mmetsp:Transcript_115183/g.325456  ORF Transcript_115183/g.325456 Transcript_115183/m.325456 type:complete len:363 (+) Transcript_115183:68-1156(+)
MDSQRVTPRALQPRWMRKEKEPEFAPLAPVAPMVIFVLGGPGSGKGTQCARISEQFGYKHLSAGDLLREECQRPNSEYGDLIRSHMSEGKLVPADISVKLLRRAMESIGWKKGKFLIDGFPRSKDNLEGWVRVMNDAEYPPTVKFCLFFDCSEASMEQRLLKRGETSGRSDDNIETIRRRFVIFQQETIPVVDHFAYEGLLRRVDANRDIEKVWHEIRLMLLQEKHTEELTREAKEEVPEWAPQGSLIKDLWRLRSKQCEEIIPAHHSHVHEPLSKGKEVRECTSFLALKQRRTQHIRPMYSPRDCFAEPASITHELGWHDCIDGVNGHSSLKPPAFPVVNCPMTRHFDSMLKMNAKNILRQ